MAVNAFNINCMDPFSNMALLPWNNSSGTKKFLNITGFSFALLVIFFWLVVNNLTSSVWDALHSPS